MTRIFFTLVILAALGGAGYWGYQQYAASNEPQSLADDPSVQVVSVSRDNLSEAVSATGSIEPLAEVEMKFETGGTVEEVLVKQGQTITAGTLLARLDTTDLELQILQAEIDLKKAQANLDKLYEPETAEKIAAAQASVRSARLTLVELQDGPDADDLTKAEVALKQTEITLQEAQWAYDQVSYRGNIGAMSQANALQEATLNYESALADYNKAVEPASEADIASARSTLANAQSSLADLLKAPSQADIISQEANVEKAKLGLEEAKRDLEGADLMAPTGGVILTVNIEPGERVVDNADNAALTIADISTYLLKMEVDELDIGRVQRGQKATVVLDAFGDQSFIGTVTDIAPSPSTGGSDGIVTYQVTIQLDTQGDNFLSGMTASANIETERLDDVLVVPSRALLTEAVAGETVTFVEQLDQRGELVRVEVMTGMRSGSLTEVVVGLDDGDEVIIR